MYLEHYGLKEPPFSITPDPRFVFLSERHRDALAHLLFGIGQGGGGGFVQLTGEVGTGKTTLCRLLLEQLPPNTRVALVLNPRVSPVELLETICEELHLELDGHSGSLKQLVDLLNTYLLQAYSSGLHVVLIIDEAQNLSIDALEQVRLLTNLETDTQKLLQIILLGQPELRDMLARPDLRQLAQRITARFHLTPLDANETERYLRHRYRVAGGQHLPFTRPAIKRLHAHSGGVPRLINVIAERSLLAGYAHDEAMVGDRLVDRAAKEALAPKVRKFTAMKAAMAVAAALAVVAVIALWLRPLESVKAAPTTAAATPAKPAASIKQLVKAAPTPVLDADTLALRAGEAGATPLAPWRHLLTLWQAPANDADAANAAACARVLAPELYCLRGTARLDKLAALGRPVLLRLRTAQGEAWAVLLGADAVRVRLRLGDTIFDTDRLALERWWNGEYAAVWRAPAFLATPISETGAAIEWVDAHLQPRPLRDENAAALLDDAMREAVRRFQSARGLLSDGVIGPETQFALAASDDGPRLLRVLE